MSMWLLGLAERRGHQPDALGIMYGLVTWVITAATSLACHPQPRTTALASAGDRATLERTTCYGTCAAYTVTADTHGTVIFDFRGRGGARGASGVVAPSSRYSGIVDPASVARLLAHIDSSGFFELSSYPETAAVCRKAYNTDLPSAIVSAAYKGHSHSVEHYLGCRAAPHILWTIERMIDSTAGSARFLNGDFGSPYGSTFIHAP
jgi:hypothetical protein